MVAQSIGVESLVEHYGISEELAEFLTRRVIPRDNLYWVGRTTYLPGLLRYLFLPCFCEATLRTGVFSFQDLDGFLLRAEGLLHHAVLEEEKIIGAAEFLARARSFSDSNSQAFIDYLEWRTENGTTDLSQDLCCFHDNELFLKGPLRRADHFLFCLRSDCEIGALRSVISFWTSLMNVMLLFDDLADLADDCLNGEPNSFYVHDDCFSLLRSSIANIEKFNSPLAFTLERFVKHNQDRWNQRILLLNNI